MKRSPFTLFFFFGWGAVFALLLNVEELYGNAGNHQTNHSKTKQPTNVQPTLKNLYVVHHKRTAHKKHRRKPTRPSNENTNRRCLLPLNVYPPPTKKSAPYAESRINRADSPFARAAIASFLAVWGGVSKYQYCLSLGEGAPTRFPIHICLFFGGGSSYY